MVKKQKKKKDSKALSSKAKGKEKKGKDSSKKIVKKWQKAAKDKRKLRKAGIDMRGETTPSQGTSPLHLLQKYKPSQTEEKMKFYRRYLT